jgi:hypothetical protein
MRVDVLDTSFNRVGEVGETLTSLEFERRWQENGALKLLINRRRMHAAEIVAGRYLYLPTEGDLLFYVESILTHEEAGQQKDLREVVCRSMDGPTLGERLVIPDVDYDVQSAVSAETAMKHYVREHAGDLAAAARQFPGLTVAADADRGIDVHVEARFQRVLDVVREIGLAAGMGWEFTLDPSVPEYVFEVLPGVDRSASVFMDIDFDTLSQYEEFFSLLDSKTMVLVAGQGEGADRELITRHAGGAEQSGFNRREAFIDARDVVLGSTDVLTQRGDAALNELSPTSRFEAAIHAFGSFQYKTHWDLGDVVLLRNAELGLAEPVRVVSVKTSVAGPTDFPSRTVELGRAMPTLKERVSPGVSSVSAGGTVDATGRHAVSHAEGGSDPLGGLLLPERLRLSAIDDASLSSVLHALQIGADGGPNLVADGNEILARNNGATAELHLNADGGQVRIGQNSPVGAALVIGGIPITRTGPTVLGLAAGDRLDGFLRFVVMRTVVHLNLTTAATIAQTATGPISGVPADAVAVQVDFRLSSTTPSPSNSMAIFHGTDGSKAVGTVYNPPTANYLNTSSVIASYSPTNGIYYSVTRTAGTITYVTVITGYFTDKA